MSDNTLPMFSSRSFTVLNPLYIILFVFGHVGSSLLDRLFSGCTEQELVVMLGLLTVFFYCCGVGALECMSFSI